MEQKVNIFRLISTIIILIVLFPGAKDAFLDITSSAKSLEDFTPEELRGDYKWIREVDLSSDGRYVAVLSFPDESIVLQEKEGNEYLVNDETSGMSELKFSSGSNYLLIGSNKYDPQKKDYGSTYVTLYNVTNKSIVRTHEMKNNYISDIDFSPDERYYASSYRKGDDSGKCTVNVWSVNSGEIVQSITSENYRALSLTFTQDSKYLVVSYDGSGYSSGSTVLYSIDTGDVYRTLNEISAFKLQLSDDGNILAEENADGKGLLVWNTDPYSKIARFTDISSPNDISLSSDGKYFMAIDDYALMIWDISSKKQILRTKVKDLDYANNFYTAKFSGDGQQILIGLEVSEDSIYSMNSRAYSGRIFAYNFTEIVESYDEG
ncbi:hypothetical protein [Methanolobus sp. WCC4]|uniref:WD40 repeat domain-containing protein n=1 Tax=Methanolobus sp. WCC4 TaxID=3125784 RepID=UPI0030FBDFA3